MNRDESVTHCKAVAIVLMVLGHALMNGSETSAAMKYVHNVIYAFHMPLFFLLSGYCFKASYLDNFKTYIKRKLLGIYWPFIMYSLIFGILSLLLPSLQIMGNVGWMGFVKLFLRMIPQTPLLGSFWFLRDLFCGTILVWLIKKYVHGFWTSAIVLTIICIILRLPIIDSANTICYSTLFILTGSWIKEKGLVNRFFQHIDGNMLRTCATIVAGMILMLAAPCLYSFEMYNVSSEMLVPCTLIAIADTFFLYYLLSKLKSTEHDLLQRMLNFVGNNTLPIFALHLLIFRIVNLLLLKAGFVKYGDFTDYPLLNTVSTSWMYIVLYTCVAVILPLIFTWAIKVCRKFG